MRNQIWNYIGHCVDEEQYLPSEVEVMEHFDSPNTPIELMELIPGVRKSYIKIHDLEGVKINDETTRVCA